GRDRICRPGGKPAKSSDRHQVTLRFHLHPDMRLYRDEEDRFVIGAPGTDLWVFTCSHHQVQAEESVFFSDIAGPQRTLQIVVPFLAAEVPAVSWQFTRAANPDLLPQPESNSRQS